MQDLPTNPSLMQTTFHLEFTQDAIDWINREFPERNWMLAPSAVFDVVSNSAITDMFPIYDVETYDTHLMKDNRVATLKRKYIKLFEDADADKVYRKLSGQFDYALLFCSGGKHTSEDMCSLVRMLCAFIMNDTTATDIYLHKLDGFLGYTGNSQIKTEWFLYAYYDTHNDDNK